ncbi:piwi-like protein Ago3 [Microplitis demolitor]|uniref:piwi-like protein Ago3 n=1 Tax=Microplitis demolitor TaxID=69319 RepID=UPI0004CD7A36|nr:piwi-like protein Ago3 [Microplitis demolitor]
MADPGRGRGSAGRGSALLAMLKKLPEAEVGEAVPHPPAPAPAPAGSQSPGVHAEPTRPRGRASLMDIARQLSAPGQVPPSPPAPSGPATVPPSRPLTVSTSVPMSGRGAGRATLLSLAQKLSPPGEPELIKPRAQTAARPGGDLPVTASVAGLSLDSSDSRGPVIRQGTDGTTIDIMSNYINIKINPSKGIHRYECKFEPETDSPRLRNALLNQHLAFLGRTKVFDGIILFLPQKLQQDRTVLESVRKDGTKITVTLIYQRQQRADCAESIQFFNILLNRILRMLKMICINKNYYNPRAPHKIEQHRMELWPGYVTAIEEMEGGLKLNIDASHRVMRTDTVRDFIQDIYKTTQDRGNFKETIFKELCGMTILTRYNNATYRVDDILWEKNPTFTFDYKGTQTSIAEYFKSHWDLVIRDLQQPLILHRAKKKLSQGGTREEEVLLVPELCYLTGLTDKVRSNFRIMKDLAQVTQVQPQERRGVIRKFIQTVNEEPAAAQLLADWGLSLADDIVRLKGRVLPAEKIIFGNSKEFNVNEKADWGPMAARNPVLTSASLQNFCIVYVQKDERIINEFAKILKNVCGTMAIKCGDPIKVPLRNDSAQSYITEIRKLINPKLDMVIAVTPTNRNDRYAAIKKLCCVESPVKSQVIMTKTISQENKIKSVTEKIALQMNCKLGGALWALKIPMNDIMVVGIDVYHAGAGAVSKASVAGFVASLNQNLTQWYSKAYFQRPGQEYVDVLRACFVSALTSYRKVRGEFPNRIVVYRDGVGDGQLNTVAGYEVEQLSKTFAMVDPNYSPKLTVVIVQKRINTRVMALKGQRLDNPPPGTIVDSEVTRRNWYDFFLVPQTARQGTVTPTHYVVLRDEAEFKTDYIQRLTYKMCHLYYNWPGTIRVPAPCQYAHKLANLVGQSIGTEPNECLAESLYYL